VGCSSQEIPNDGPSDEFVDQEPQFALVLESGLTISAGEDSVPWVLGKPRAVVEAPNGLVYILDSDWKRITAHSRRTGSLERTIGNGYGIGSGQFTLPVDMRLSASTLYVLDYELRRLSAYDTSGYHIRDVDVASVYPRHFDIARDEIYVRLLFPKDRRAIGVLDLSGTLQRYAVPLTSRDRRLPEAGIPGALSAGQDSESILYVNSDVSTLIRIAKDSTTTTRLANPGTVITRSIDGQALPWLLSSRSAGGIAALRGGRIAVLRALVDPSLVETKENIPVKHDIVVYSREGVLMGQASLEEEGLPLSISPGLTSDVVYIAFIGNLPRVTRIELNMVDQLSARGSQ
jgi:hypothetical protein